MKPNPVTALLCLLLLSFKTKAQTSTAHAPAINQKSNTMKEFSLLVRVPVTYSNEQAKAVGPAWDQTLAQWKSDGVYVTSFAFPGESYVVAGPEKTIRKETVVSDNLRVVSNIVLRAPTMEAVLELAKSCPILEYGGTVEVREIPKGRVVPID